MISHGFTGQRGNHQIHQIDSVVEVLEPTGPDTLVFININGKEVRCRVPPDSVKSPGEHMKLMVDMSKALFFNPQTEERIGVLGND